MSEIFKLEYLKSMLDRYTNIYKSDFELSDYLDSKIDLKTSNIANRLDIRDSDGQLLEVLYNEYRFENKNLDGLYIIGYDHKCGNPSEKLKVLTYRYCVDGIVESVNDLPSVINSTQMSFYWHKGGLKHRDLDIGPAVIKTDCIEYCLNGEVVEQISWAKYLSLIESDNLKADIKQSKLVKSSFKL